MTAVPWYVLGEFPDETIEDFLKRTSKHQNILREDGVVVADNTIISSLKPHTLHELRNREIYFRDFSSSISGSRSVSVGSKWGESFCDGVVCYSVSGALINGDDVILSSDVELFTPETPLLIHSRLETIFLDLTVIKHSTNSVKRWSEFALNTLEYDYKRNFFCRSYVFKEIEKLLALNGDGLYVVDEEKSPCPEEITFGNIHTGLTVHLKERNEVNASLRVYTGNGKLHQLENFSIIMHAYDRQNNGFPVKILKRRIRSFLIKNGLDTEFNTEKYHNAFMSVEYISVQMILEGLSVSLKDWETKLEISSRIGRFGLQAISDYSETGALMNNRLEGCLSLIESVSSCTPIVSTISICAPSWSGKTQLAFALNCHAAHPTRITGIPMTECERPRISCVVHLLMDAVDYFYENIQKVYMHLRSISYSFMKALKSDFEKFSESSALDPSELISDASIMNRKEFEYGCLGIVYALLMMRKEGKVFNFDDTEKTTVPKKTFKQLKRLLTKLQDPDSSGVKLTAVIVLDEFNVRGCADKNSLFFVRNLLRICGFAVITLGTDPNAIDSRVLHDNFPSAHVVTNLPSASPSSMTLNMVYHESELRYIFRSFGNLDPELSALLSATTTWRERFQLLNCPTELIDWILPESPQDPFPHCVRPGIMVMFLANVLKVLFERKSKNSEITASSLDILGFALKSTGGDILSRKRTMNAGEVHFNLCCGAMENQVHSNGPENSLTIYSHLAFLRNPLENHEQRFDDFEYFPLHCSDPAQQPLISEGFYPRFQIDEITNMSLMISKQQSFRSGQFHKLFHEKSNEDAQMKIDLLLMSSCVQASWAKGLKGLNLAEFLTALSKDIGQPMHDLSEAVKNSELMAVQIPLFAPINCHFSPKFILIEGIKIARLSTVKNQGGVDGFAFTDNASFLMTFHEGNHAESMDCEHLKDIVQNARKFGSSLAFGGSRFDCQVSLVLAKSISIKDKNTTFPPGIVVYYPVLIKSTNENQPPLYTLEELINTCGDSSPNFIMIVFTPKK